MMNVRKESRVESDAQQIMLEKQLIFFPVELNSIKNLTEFVSKKNALRYNKPEFEYIQSKYDKDLIIAAVPSLGPNELGLFAGKNFVKDEVIATYEGKNWLNVPKDEIETKILNSENSGDYFWEIKGKNGQAMAVDTITMGTAARFANDSYQRNAYVELKNGIVYYIASKPIKFGEEITVSYGNDYFDKSNPRIGYTPETLQTILGNLYKIKYKEIIPTSSLNCLESIAIFLNILGWNTRTSNCNEMQITHQQHQGTLGLPTVRNNTSKDLFLDKQNRPLVFDLSKKEDCYFLGETKSIKFSATSKFRFFVAPTGRIEGQTKFSLFAGENIKKNAVVCTVEGENLTQKEIKKYINFEENLLFEINTKKNIYCKNKGSEALFIQGVCSEKNANVTFMMKKKEPIYVAMKDIEAGSEIVTFYGENYFFGADKISHLASTIYDFNQNQLVYDAFLTYNAKVMTYSLELKKNILAELSIQEVEFSEIVDKQKCDFSIESLLTGSGNSKNHKVVGGRTGEMCQAERENNLKPRVSLDLICYEVMESWSPNYFRPQGSDLPPPCKKNRLNPAENNESLSKRKINS